MPAGDRTAPSAAERRVEVLLDGLLRQPDLRGDVACDTGCGPRLPAAARRAPPAYQG